MYRCCNLLLLLAFAAIVADSAPLSAQPGGRGGRSGRGEFNRGDFGRGEFGRGGFGGAASGSGLLAELRRDTVQSELDLTDEQRESVDELGRDIFSPSPEMQDLFSRMRDASDDEREEIREQLQELGEQRARETEQQLREILSDEQFTRLQQISWHRMGGSALTQPSVMDALELRDEQRLELEQLQAEYSAARAELGFRASTEEREALREEWEEKFLAVLDDSQKATWTETLGPPPADQPGGNGATTQQPVAGATPPAPRRQQIDLTPPPAGAEIISSFGAPGDTGDARASETPEFSFNFRYAPWGDVLRLFASRAGLTLDLIDVPPGTFSYFDDGTYTITEALDILNGYLLPKGYVLVRRDRFLVSVAIDAEGGIPPNLIPHVTREELYRRGQNELLTVVFALEGLDVNNAANDVRELLGPQGKVVGLASTNSLVVTDIGINLRRVEELLQTASGGPEDIVFRSYTLKHIAVDEAEETVRGLLGLPVGAANVSTANERGGERIDRRMLERMQEMARRGGGGDSGPAARNKPDPTIASNLRTNSLLVAASPSQQRIVEETINVIDVDEEPSNFFARSRKPYLEVYEVKQSDPREVVKTLGVLVPGVVVNEDGRNDKIHILATELQHREVAALIRQLDGMGGGEQVAVIPLARMDPITAASQLTAMFTRDGTGAPTIEPDLYGRQLMVRGSATQLAQIQQILSQLGEDGTGRQSGLGTTIRSFPIAGRDPQEVLEMLQRSWEAENEPNPVRIVRPRDRSPIEAIRTPNASPTTTEQRRDEGPSASLQPRNRSPFRFAMQVETVAPASAQSTQVSEDAGTTASSPSVPANAPPPAQEAAPVATQPDESAAPPVTPAESGNPDSATGPASELPSQSPPATQPSGEAKQPSGESPTVDVTVVGDEFIITSSDPEALDRMEAMLEELMQTLPPRTTWTIYPLEHADVITTASMLEQLFPDSSVVSADSLGGSSGIFGSLSGSFSQLTSGLSGIAGLSGSAGGIRMIPYPPDNALFVSGPTYKVREIEQMLQILDSGDLSASLRDRKPRTIPVLHADVDQVYQVVRDVYKDLLESDQDRGARTAANVMAQMMGGGGRRGGGGQQSQPAASLSLGVDRQTSQIIVSSSEAIYEDVRKLVETLDTDAHDARPTVQVISLQNTSTSAIKGTLGSLMPRVQVSATSARPQTGASGSGSSGGGGGADRGERREGGDDDMRRMFEQRMRERMQMQQGSGDSRGSGASRGDSGRPSFRSFGGSRGSTGGRSFGGGRSSRGR